MVGTVELEKLHEVKISPRVEALGTAFMVLIVEDNANARQLFARIVSIAGHEVLESKDGEEALQLFEQHRVDLLITDLALPKITGVGLIDQIHQRSPHLPVIIVSAYLSPDEAKILLDEHVEFIPKPVDRDHLIATVNRLAPAIA